MLLVSRYSALFGGVLLFLALGCNKNSASRYVPSERTAKQSLEAALDLWKSGKPPGKIDTVKPIVQAVDSRWLAGERLAGYEILGEETSTGPKVFSVRLTLSKPAGERVVRYYVLGTDTVWVYREEDYQKRSSEM